MEKLKRSPAELLAEVEIELVEQECLNRVFNWLTSQDPKKSVDMADKITSGDLSRALRKMGSSPTKSEVNNMIWEVDDDLDSMINKDEFLTMYKR